MSIWRHWIRLFGDYESLTAGKAKDALVDMLGGVGQSIDLKNHPQDDEKQSQLFDQLLEAFQHDSQMTASISVRIIVETDVLSGIGLCRSSVSDASMYFKKCVIDNR